MMLTKLFLLVACCTALALAQSETISETFTVSSVGATATTAIPIVSVSVVASSASPSPSPSSSSANFSRTASPSASPVPLTQQRNDIRALLYIYTFEKLESTFLNESLSMFNQTDFENSGYNAQILTYMRLMATHETTHYMTLAQLLTMRNETIPASCNYTMSNMTTVDDFIAMATAMQETGVSAYNGLINRVSDPYLQEILATIATVEARHAAWLKSIRDMNPFPEAFDNATSPQQIAQTLLTDFISSCPFNLTATLPVLRNETVPQVNSVASTATRVATITVRPSSTSNDTSSESNSAQANAVGSQLLSFAASIALVASTLRFL